MPDALLDFERLDALARAGREDFARALPFPHAVVDDFLPAEVAERVHDEFDDTDAGWDSYHHYNEKKEAVTTLEAMRPHTRALFDALQSQRFRDFVETLTGLEGLLPDPDLDGAGLHKTRPGGFLNVHTDFLSHPAHPTWDRQVNLLVYFNKDWKPEWQGGLELWDEDMTRCVRKVEPVFNRAVIFRTSDRSYHGHPQRLACPPDRFRRSLALYYFHDTGVRRELSSTGYRPIPSDPLPKRALIAVDRGLLRAYAFVRRHTGISNGSVARFLKRLS